MKFVPGGNRRWVWLLLLPVLFVTVIASAAQPVVSNTDNDGPGSLRAAIMAANGGVNPLDRHIAFNIPGPGLHVIEISTALPAILDGVTIGGRSQPGFSGEPLIEIRGAERPQPIERTAAMRGDATDPDLGVLGAPDIIRGLDVAGSNVLIDSLIVRRFVDAIRLRNDNNLVDNCVIRQLSRSGIVIDGSDNVVNDSTIARVKGPVIGLGLGGFIGAIIIKGDRNRVESSYMVSSRFASLGSKY